METTRKTILLAGNMCGGGHKSTTIATLGDCLQTLGHRVKYIALDVAPMLKLLHPTTTQYDPRSTEAMYQAMQDAVDCPEDIVLVDCPGAGWGEELPELATRAQQDLVARVIIAPIVNAQAEYSFKGALEFSKTFHKIQNDIIIANNWQENAAIPNLLEIQSRKLLAEISEGRVIQFPPFSAGMRDDFNQNPAVPSAFIAKADPFRAAPWQRYHRQCLESVSQHAGWLMGKPAPTPALIP